MNRMDAEREEGSESELEVREKMDAEEVAVDEWRREAISVNGERKRA